MTAPANTTTTLVSIGNREDLENNIYRVVPWQTPLINNIGGTKAKAIFHEWQTETLATPSATASTALEGGDTSNDNPNLTARVGNYCQINLKGYGVSGTQEVVDKAGRASEITRQRTLKGLEIKRDLELRVTGNYASNVESGATTRKTAGILAWLTSNVSRGSGGSSGGFSAGIVAAATNGTQRTLTESLVKTVLSSCFSNGGKPTQAYMGPTHKQQFSSFTGIASIRKDVKGDSMASIIGAADVYVSDFGNLALIPHPYGPGVTTSQRDLVLVDPDMAAIGTLRGWTDEELSKTGDSEKRQVLAEKCLVVKNEKAHGVVADLL
jgi:hypothetical protein